MLTQKRKLLELRKKRDNYLVRKTLDDLEKAAAGNDNVSTAHYPSAYTHVISIASTDGDDLKSDFSNYGTTVDLCSPGGSNAGGPSGLLSTTFSTGTYGNYDLMQGTSMASPVATGMAGLILSLNP